MSHISEKPRVYHPDYTETMDTPTLLKIRADLEKMPQIGWRESWEAKRMKRIDEVLRLRNQLPKS